ncbi:adenylosuccinate lyase [Sulfobacillus thermosulfidooxidans]|uniref:adenylosuccinate lyase n=1 Tax=Sulfobacillus thermosulfidooxidans TaxID=28034 RepID=UPI0006B65233|nr:adenylosuccinate lyase [Sulfobacillus thermosulfidooxidans]
MINRYARPIMQTLWSDQNRYNRWLDIERYVVEAWEHLGVIPQGVADRLKKATVDPARVDEYEKTFHHDVIAFINAAGETVAPEDAKYIHFGLTSTDVVDTALSSLIRDSLEIILDDLRKLQDVVRELAIRYKDTPVMGRTHGIHAEPTSFGLKLALWWLELGRDYERIDRARDTISVIKISGAVGNYANISPDIEEFVAQKMGMKPAPLSTQVLQRDRHAEVIASLAILGGTLDKIATEIRHMQRTELGELAEPFGEGQRGSSAMPHKRNPVMAEQISGLSRILRGYMVPALDDMALWHERDISHSSVERVIFPDATTLADYLLDTMLRIMQGLTVNTQRMRENIDLTGGLVFSQKILLALVEAGMTREEAYKRVQSHAMAAMKESSPNFQERILHDPEIEKYLTADKIVALFAIEPYLKEVDRIYRRIGLID